LLVRALPAPGPHQHAGECCPAASGCLHLQQEEMRFSCRYGRAATLKPHKAVFQQQLLSLLYPGLRFQPQNGLCCAQVLNTPSHSIMLSCSKPVDCTAFRCPNALTLSRPWACVLDSSTLCTDYRPGTQGSSGLVRNKDSTLQGKPVLNRSTCEVPCRNHEGWAQQSMQEEVLKDSTFKGKAVLKCSTGEQQARATQQLLLIGCF
jgi:hypothetical protein